MRKVPVKYDFDHVIDRRHSDSTKWRHYEADVLPLWTADMDFVSPAPVMEALAERIGHGIFGYCVESDELRQVVAARMASLYGWHVQPEAVLFQTGVLAGFRQVCRAAAAAREGVLVQPPVYPPIFGAPAHNGSIHQESPLIRRESGRYEIDFDAFESAITPETRVFILCNPHNPVGRVFTRPELEKLAETCVRHDVVICSDEIHADLVFGAHRHTPIASIDPEVARRSVTLMAPSKTYNVAGLRCSMAIVPDAELRRRLQDEHTKVFAEVNSLGLVAALAAYRDGQEWLEQVLAYLEVNRNLVVDFVRRELPGITTDTPEATYLAWLDCRQGGIQGNAYQFFLDHGRVALQDGAAFGTTGEGFVRLNFGCPRTTLVEALGRMKRALGSRMTAT
ncbi:MAG: PatB family C-S lyase [Acidobacteriota bacterium]